MCGSSDRRRLHAGSGGGPLAEPPPVSVPATTPWIFYAMFIQYFLCMLYDYPQLFYAYTQNFLWFIITVFMLHLNMMCNEIVLNFGHGGMYSIHWWTKFLYIIGAHFYILLEQLSVHFYTIIHCWSTLLCIVRTLWHKLLEQFSLHFYTILYIVGTQFYSTLISMRDEN